MTKPSAEIGFSDYRPGALGRVVELHALYYAREWDFPRAFETKVAAEMAEFLGRQDPAFDFFRIALEGNRIVGSITLDGSENADNGAHLRWFVVADGLRGGGVGGRLIEQAVAFARQRGFDHIYLWTFEGLEAARRFYERAGFVLEEEHRGRTWGAEVVEQKFVFRL